MRLPPRREMTPDSPALRAEQLVAPIKHVRSLDLLHGTTERPQEHCHKSRRTLMLPLEHEICRFPSNQLEMKPDSPAFPPETSRIPNHTRQVA